MEITGNLKPASNRLLNASSQSHSFDISLGQAQDLLLLPEAASELALGCRCELSNDPDATSTASLPPSHSQIASVSAPASYAAHIFPPASPPSPTPGPRQRLPRSLRAGSYLPALDLSRLRAGFPPPHRRPVAPSPAHPLSTSRPVFQVDLVPRARAVPLAGWVPPSGYHHHGYGCAAAPFDCAGFRASLSLISSAGHGLGPGRPAASNRAA
jgi:hypothetical protein